MWACKINIALHLGLGTQFGLHRMFVKPKGKSLNRKTVLKAKVSEGSFI